MCGADENEKGECDMGTDAIREYGKCQLGNIQLLSIIGEIEGHECVSENTKSTKYEHLLPLLASVEEDADTEGILFLINTVGGDVSCGLALAEMIAGISKPTVSLIIGDSHSIGVPLAVATDHSFIVPSATMIIHPVRMSGMVIGAPQTYGQFQQIQDRIIDFIVRNCEAEKHRIEELMMNSCMLSKDLGTVLVGKEAVKERLVNEVGTISTALDYIKKRCAAATKDA